jgi:hypothetical protein
VSHAVVGRIKNHPAVFVVFSHSILKSPAKRILPLAAAFNFNSAIFIEILFQAVFKKN